MNTYLNEQGVNRNIWSYMPLFGVDDLTVKNQIIEWNIISKNFGGAYQIETDQLTRYLWRSLENENYFLEYYVFWSKERP